MELNILMLGIGNGVIGNRPAGSSMGISSPAKSLYKPHLFYWKSSKVITVYFIGITRTPLTVKGVVSHFVFIRSLCYPLLLLLADTIHGAGKGSTRFLLFTRDTSRWIASVRTRPFSSNKAGSEVRISKSRV